MKKMIFFIKTIGILGVFVSSAFAVDGIKFDFHGNMLQVVGSTSNNMSLAGKQKSGKTDYFSYDNMLNIKGYKDQKDFYKYMNYYNTVGTTFGLSKARLRFEAKTDDNLAKFVYGLELGTVNWGDKDKKFGLSGDGVTQESRYAYAEVKSKQESTEHKVRAGLQPTKINKWVWSETAAGLTYHGKSAARKWMLGWYRGDEDARDNNTDNNYLVLKTSGPMTSNLDMDLFLIFEQAAAEKTMSYTSLTSENKIEDTYDRSNHYLGASLSYNASPFSALFEFVYQWGDISFEDDDMSENNLERSASLINLELGYQINKQLKIRFNSLHVSGDNNPNDLDANNFDAIDVDVKVGMILFKDSLTSSCDRFVSDAPYLMDKGLIHHALMADYKPSKKHQFFTAIRYLSLAEDILDDDGNKESSIGTELDFKYAYKFNKYVKLRLEAACLLPDGASNLMTADSKDADTIFNFASGIQFKF